MLNSSSVLVLAVVHNSTLDRVLFLSQTGKCWHFLAVRCQWNCLLTIEYNFTSLNFRSNERNLFTFVICVIGMFLENEWLLKIANFQISYFFFWPPLVEGNFCLYNLIYETWDGFYSYILLFILGGPLWLKYYWSYVCVLLSLTLLCFSFRD